MTDSTNASMLKYLEKDIDLIQSFMNENIGPDGKMTGANIYESLKNKLSHKTISSGVFASALSITIRAGIITGFEGRKRVGYVRIGSTVKASPVIRTAKVETQYNDANIDNDLDEGEDDGGEKFCIKINNTLRIVIDDKRNYTRQRFVNGAWKNQSYFTSLGSALKITVNYLIKNKLKTKKEMHTLEEAIAAVREAEAAILGELIHMSNGHQLERIVQNAEPKEVLEEISA